MQHSRDLNEKCFQDCSPDTRVAEQLCINCVLGVKVHQLWKIQLVASNLDRVEQETYRTELVNVPVLI